MNMDMGSGWRFMHDGSVFAEFNHQGGERGGDEFVAPNWWMGMATRDTSRGRLTFTGMFSLDPATVGMEGYREILQSGEALNGRPIIDHQHPHDLLMQLAAIWRVPMPASVGLTFAAAPVGEPALGPIAFMHRASAADNPTAPLGHHLFDSTHVSFGVVAAALDRGPWVLEGSVFNGREPDQDRWDFDFGRLDSFSGRLWFRPRPTWAFQISRGHLTSPEALEPGNIDRTTASGSWTRTTSDGVTSIGGGLGRNDSDHGARNGLFLEAARQSRRGGLYTRFEALQVETSLLLTGLATDGDAFSIKDPVRTATLGGTGRIFGARRIEGSLGLDLTFYSVPASLKTAYGHHPVSFHLFFRLRPVAGSMGRMWNMQMSRPMG